MYDDASIHPRGFVHFAVSTHRRLVFYENQKPSLGGSSFIAPSATVVGGVTFGKAVAVMYGVVVRGMLIPVNDQCVSLLILQVRR